MNELQSKFTVSQRRVPQLRDRVSIHDRPKLVEKRKRIGDWELDLVRCHRASGYLITAVDRMTGSAREKSGPQVQ